MTDAREKQPDRAEFDWTRKTSGNHTWRVSLWCPTYNGIKGENVYVANPTILLKAMDFEGACEMAGVIAAAIHEAHDIWQVKITGVTRNDRT